MSAKAVEKFFFFASVEILLEFFERKVNDIVVVQLFGLDEIAKAQPEAVQEIDFVGGEVRRVGTEDLKDFIASREMDFEVELRLGIAKAFPGFANLASLLFALPLPGRAGDDGGRFKALSGAKNTVPQIVGGDDSEANGFAAFFREAESLREKVLLDAAKELIGVEFLLTGCGAAQDADVKDDNIATAGLQAIENVCEMVEIKLIADGNEDVAGLRADGLRSEFAFNFEIELIHLNVGGAGRTGATFGNGENDKEKN